MTDGLSLRHDDGVLRVSGDLDAHSAPTLEAALADQDGRVLLDLGGVGFADSSGLRVLLGAHQRLTGAGGALVIVEASERVERLLSVTGLDGVIPRS